MILRTAYATENKDTDIGNLVNQDLERIADWLKINKLSLNLDKTNACHFTSARSELLTKPMISGVTLKLADTVKCLGVFIDNQLSWKPHIAYVTNKVNKVLGVMCKIRRYLPVSAMKTIYFALVHSVMSYCLEIWSCAFPTLLEPLTRAQNKILRVILKEPSRSHSLPLYKKLNIFPLKSEITFRKAFLAFRCIKNPSFFNISLDMNHTHDYPTRFKCKDNVPVMRTLTKRYGTMGLKNTLSRAYNELPYTIKRLSFQDLKLVKRQLKLRYSPTAIVTGT